MSEEFRLGDSDLMLPNANPRPVTFYHNYTTTWGVSDYTENYEDSFNSSQFVRDTINYMSERVRRSTDRYVFSVDPAAEGESTTAASYWSIANGYHDDYEESKPLKNIFKTKEDVFVGIVNIITNMKFCQRNQHTRDSILKMIHSYRDWISKFFDDCSFICDGRNNKNKEGSEYPDIVLDFYFTEKDIKVKRTYRFALFHDGSMQVFERYRKP